MSNVSHKDFACLLNINESIDKIKQYISPYSDADEFHNDSKSFDAVMMNFVDIREMAEKLSEKFKDDTDEEFNWLKIRGFRNIIAHNYFGIDAEEVWQIINNNLVDLENKVKAIIET